MASVAAGQRREQAREVALELLRHRRFENLSLRDVARQLDISLSTLTYVYSSVADLLDDFDGYIDEPALGRVGDGGLRVELVRYLDEALAVITADRGLREIWRYRLTRVGGRAFAGGLARNEEMVTQIRTRGGESYRRSDADIARLLRWLTVGSLLHWLDSESDDAQDWRQDMELSIEILLLAADPQPN